MCSGAWPLHLSRQTEGSQGGGLRTGPVVCLCGAALVLQPWHCSPNPSAPIPYSWSYSPIPLSTIPNPQSLIPQSLIPDPAAPILYPRSLIPGPAAAHGLCLPLVAAVLGLPGGCGPCPGLPGCPRIPRYLPVPLAGHTRLHPSRSRGCCGCERGHTWIFPSCLREILSAAAGEKLFLGCLASRLVGNEANFTRVSCLKVEALLFPIICF